MYSDSALLELLLVLNRSADVENQEQSDTNQGRAQIREDGQTGGNQEEDALQPGDLLLDIALEETGEAVADSDCGEDRHQILEGESRHDVVGIQREGERQDKAGDA